MWRCCQRRVLPAVPARLHLTTRTCSGHAPCLAQRAVSGPLPCAAGLYPIRLRIAIQLHLLLLRRPAIAGVPFTSLPPLRRACVAGSAGMAAWRLPCSICTSINSGPRLRPPPQQAAAAIIHPAPPRPAMPCAPAGAGGGGRGPVDVVRPGAPGAAPGAALPRLERRAERGGEPDGWNG